MFLFVRCPWSTEKLAFLWSYVKLYSRMMHSLCIFGISTSISVPLLWVSSSMKRRKNDKVCPVNSETFANLWTFEPFLLSVSQVSHESSLGHQRRPFLLPKLLPGLQPPRGHPVRRQGGGVCQWNTHTLSCCPARSEVQIRRAQWVENSSRLTFRESLEGKFQWGESSHKRNDHADRRSASDSPSNALEYVTYF